MLLWSEELGVNIAVCPCLQLTSHTPQKHHPFENKVWEIYVYKEGVRSFIEVRILCWIMFCIYLYMYYGIQHLYDLVPMASSCPYGMVSNLSLDLRSKKRPMKILTLEERRETKRESATERTRHEKKEEKWRDWGKEQRKMQQTGRKKKTRTDLLWKTEKMKKKKKKEKHSKDCK